MTEACIQAARFNGKPAGREMIHNMGDVVGVEL